MSALMRYRINLICLKLSHWSTYWCRTLQHYINIVSIIYKNNVFYCNWSHHRWQYLTQNKLKYLNMYINEMHYIIWCLISKGSLVLFCFIFTFLYIIGNIVVISPYHHTCYTYYYPGFGTLLIILIQVYTYFSASTFGCISYYFISFNFQWNYYWICDAKIWATKETKLHICKWNMPCSSNLHFLTKRRRIFPSNGFCNREIL